MMQPSGLHLSYEELSERANRFASYLVMQGIKRLAFLMENRLECAELLLGAQAAGADHLLLNNHSKNPDDLLGILADFRPTLVVATDSYLEMAAHLERNLDLRVQRIMLGKPLRGWMPYDAIHQAMPQKAPKLPGGGRLYPTSGGTTGRPKVIVPPEPVGPVSPPIQSLRQMSPEDVGLVTGPLHHGLHNVLLVGALQAGAQVIIMESWDPVIFLQTISAFRVTRTNIVPTMMKRLLELPLEARTCYDLSSLERVMHAAAPCPLEVKAQFLEWFGDSVIEVYGMSEGFGFTVITAAEWRARPGSVGRALGGHRIIIRDGEGNELPPNEEGIIWFASERPSKPMVYIGNKAESEACYNQHGEGTAGDVGWLDEEGFLYVTGRVKSMIITGGNNVFLEPTESVLTEQPEVSDACAYGHPHPDLGERMRALVVLQPGIVPNKELAAYLIDACKKRLGRYAAPEQISFVDEVPRIPNGKIDRRAVKELTRVM